MAATCMITLMDCRKYNSRPEHAFRVVKLVNSIEYQTEQYLSMEDVQSLCDDEEWKVTINPFKR